MKNMQIDFQSLKIDTFDEMIDTATKLHLSPQRIDLLKSLYSISFESTNNNHVQKTALFFYGIMAIIEEEPSEAIDITRSNIISNFSMLEKLQFDAIFARLIKLNNIPVKSRVGRTYRQAEYDLRSVVEHYHYPTEAIAPILAAIKKSLINGTIARTDLNGVIYSGLRHFYKPSSTIVRQLRTYFNICVPTVKTFIEVQPSDLPSIPITGTLNGTFDLNHHVSTLQTLFPMSEERQHLFNTWLEVLKQHSLTIERVLITYYYAYNSSNIVKNNRNFISLKKFAKTANVDYKKMNAAIVFFKRYIDVEIILKDQKHGFSFESYYDNANPAFRIDQTYFHLANSLFEFGIDHNLKNSASLAAAIIFIIKRNFIKEPITMRSFGLHCGKSFYKAVAILREFLKTPQALEYNYNPTKIYVPLNDAFESVLKYYVDSGVNINRVNYARYLWNLIHNKKKQFALNKGAPAAIIYIALGLRILNNPPLTQTDITITTLNYPLLNISQEFISDLFHISAVTLRSILHKLVNIPIKYLIPTTFYDTLSTFESPSSISPIIITDKSPSFSMPIEKHEATYPDEHYNFDIAMHFLADHGYSLSLQQFNHYKSILKNYDNTLSDGIISAIIIYYILVIQEKHQCTIGKIITPLKISPSNFMETMIRIRPVLDQLM